MTCQLANCRVITRISPVTWHASLWDDGKLIRMVSIAYWIAFGPHGPRAVDPPGTNARVAWGVAVGLAASFAIFAAIRSVAKPEPHTMSKEYQEASNELLIVSWTQSLDAITPGSMKEQLLTLLSNSNKKPTLSPVLPPRATVARAWSSLLPRATKLRLQIPCNFSFVIEG